MASEAFKKYKKVASEGEPHTLPGSGVEAVVRILGVANMATKAGVLENELADDVIRWLNGMSDVKPGEYLTDQQRKEREQRRIDTYKGTLRAMQLVVCQALVDPPVSMDGDPANGVLAITDINDHDMKFICDLQEMTAEQRRDPFRLFYRRNDPKNSEPSQPVRRETE